MISPDDPRHGRPSGYGLGCRCDQCALSWNRKNKRWALNAQRNGGRTTVDAAEFIDGLRELNQRMSHAAISDAIGASAGYVSRLVRGEIGSVSLARADAIRRLTAATDPFATTGSYVSSLPSTRRLRALTAIGYSQYRIAETVGISRNAVIGILHGTVPMIHGSTHAQIKEAYDRVSMTFPVGANPSEVSGITRARNLAKRREWAPPLAWDEATINDPTATPNVIGVERPKKVGSGRTTELRDRIIEDAQWLADADETLTSVLSRLGMNAEHLYQTCRRANRLDLYATLSRREPAGDRAHDMRNIKAGAA